MIECPTPMPDTAQPEPVPVESTAPSIEMPQTPTGNFCSTGWTTAVGYNMKTVTENLKVAIFKDQPYEDYMNGALSIAQLDAIKPECEFIDSALLNELRTEKVLRLRDLGKNCPKLAPGQYRVAIVKASETNKYTHSLLMEHNIGLQGIPLNVATPEQMHQFSVAHRVRAVVTSMGENKLKFAFKFHENPFAGGMATMLNGTYGEVNCDMSASPLVVQMKASSPLKLTSREDGILFDILGKNAQPAAHTKKQISWLAPEAAEGNYFITLPNARGEVNGIDEMFGNNTAGPDGKFAQHGYLALAKHDDDKDGLISKKDAVFTKLRLWKDKNVDGIAQVGELIPLDELDVKSIDTRPDSSFRERDAFGNEISLKSVLQTTDGKLHVVYDIWFSLN